MQRILLSGEFDHTLDDKGRLTLPARFREYFANGAQVVRMRNAFGDRGWEPCIRVYTQEAWEAFDKQWLDPLNPYSQEEDQWAIRDIYGCLDPA